MTKAAIIGLGTMGPGIARDPGARRHGRALPSTPMPISAPGARSGFQVGGRCARRLGMPDRSEGAAIAICDSLADCVAGADLVLENVPEKLEIKAEVFRQIEAARRQGLHHRLRHLGHSDHQAPGIRVGAGACRRHALVEPAAHHPDDRGDRRRRRPRPRWCDWMVATDQGHRPAAGGREEGRARLRREPRALCAAARMRRPGRTGRDRCRGPRYLRLLGHRLQARRWSGPMALLDMAGPRHLPGGRQLSEQGALQPRRRRPVT